MTAASQTSPGTGLAPASRSNPVSQSSELLTGVWADLVGQENAVRALRRAVATWYAEGELAPDNPVDPPDHVVHRRSCRAAERAFPACHRDTDGSRRGARSAGRAAGSL